MPVGSEDCLTLNVWAPASRTGAPLPVFFFVHGGFFTWGASSYRRDGVDAYDGAYIAEHAPAIVVTLNYRLGPFGFLAHPALAAESPRHASGNYGLLDQIAALEWVHRNIHAFGGDPGKVLLFGQSAGAISTAALYAAPRARGLFSAAVMHSGNGHAMPKARAEALGTDLAKLMGCDKTPDAAGCLRARSASAIVAALPESFDGEHAYGPAVDGDLLAATPIELVRGGSGAGVPLIVGTTANEFSTMAHHYLTAPLKTEEDFRSAIEKLSHRATAEERAPLFEAYPVSAYPSPLAAYVALRGDFAFQCPSNAFAGAAAQVSPGRVWRSVYAHHNASGHSKAFGAGHGMDLPYLFHVPVLYDYRSTEDEARLADEMLARWAELARHGVPDAPGLLPWRPYSAPEGGGPEETRGAYLELDTPSSMKTRFREAECRLWRSMR